jgi:ATP-dependent DNA helicase RecG
VSFARLGLVVVDEQHRLGVAQRLSLVAKGKRPHLLTLSATPIPRTLALALRGELATSILDERPRGRPPVGTELVPRAKLDRVIDELRAVCARGERAFFVAPHIEDDDEDEDEDAGGAAGVEARAAELSKRLAPARVLLMHGGLNAETKRRVMREFRRGTGSDEGTGAVLVGTTVVEVGVDVPEATLMVVDGAEHFGMAQLHQLRGRVGRGDRPGRCLLVHDTPLSPTAQQRLAALATHDDGATLARIDLELRGAGELGGTRQSGAEQGLVYLDPGAPPAWLDRVEDDARAIVAADPDLTLPEHRALALQMRRFAGSLAVREEAG